MPRDLTIRCGEEFFPDRGMRFAGVVITDTVRPGVVRMSCGAWHDPGERCCRRALRAWQCRCTDPRSRHVAPEPGAEFGDGVGGSGAVHTAAPGQSLRASAVSRGRLTRRATRLPFRAALRFPAAFPGVPLLRVLKRRFRWAYDAIDHMNLLLNVLRARFDFVMMIDSRGVPWSSWGPAGVAVRAGP
jgi:hypothetical protein